MTEINIPELLAPAKDAFHGKIAVNAGADAVYIGAGGFSARRNADNDVAEVAHLVSYAHRYQVRVYAAVNTILFDDEIPKAARLIHQLYEAGVDGAIIQDLGLLEADLPPLPLIASTQTHNNSAGRINFLAAAGFSRVILPRELSIEEMGQIRNETKVSLEAFVHGALCMSYSGRCYLSYKNGGRSANRGACAQPCRKRYSLVDGNETIKQTGHFLSMKDLNRISLLGEMLDAGISSFKIEGRLKDTTYIATVVAAYRKALDKALNERSLQRRGDEYALGFSPDLSRVFTRGFVEGFARDDEIMATLSTPKSVGAPLGKAINRVENTIWLDGKTVVSPGDGLCYFDKNKNLTGARIETTVENIAVLSDAGTIEKGTFIYRNRDHAHIEAVKTGPILRKVPVNMTLLGNTKLLRLTIKDNMGHEASSELSGESSSQFEEARNQEKARNIWIKQLKKTGDTEFICKSVHIEIKSIPFVSMAKINAFRRDALDYLSKIRIKEMQHVPDEKNPDIPIPSIGPELGFEANISNKYANKFHKRHGAKSIVPAPEAGTPLNNQIVMTSKYCLRRELKACLLKNEGSSLKAPIYIIDEETGNRLKLEFNCTSCEMNVHSID
ncbi:MAG: U32 family peptidase [Deltaproteobacteria bacterium]|nr:U32 family peptidase [Deltaproteobacteria bacterium]